MGVFVCMGWELSAVVLKQQHSFPVMKNSQPARAPLSAGQKLPELGDSRTVYTVTISPRCTEKKTPIIYFDVHI